MKARDVMVSPVVTVKPQDTVKKIAELFLRRGISAAPVVDDHAKVIGIISELICFTTRKLIPNGSIRAGSGCLSKITTSPRNSSNRMR